MPDQQEMEKESPGFFARVKGMFHHEQGEQPTYNRRLLDGKIERYLDENFTNYVEEYSLVTALELTSYDERVTELEPRVSMLLDSTVSMDADVSDLERRVRTLKEVSKKGLKKA